MNIKKYASDLQAYIAVNHDTCLQSIINSDSLNQTTLSYKIDRGLMNITTSIQTFGEVVVESKPCELTFSREKDRQAQMMVADLSEPMSVDKIQLNMKQKINIEVRFFRGCSLFPDGIIALSSWQSDTVRFINKEGVELFQIGRDKTGSDNYDTLYIKDNNSVAVSSGGGGKRCTTIIDIENQEVKTTISMATCIYGMVIRGRTMYYCAGSKGLKMLNLFF